jgi:hypothetical protein
LSENPMHYIELVIISDSIGRELALMSFDKENIDLKLLWD